MNKVGKSGAIVTIIGSAFMVIFAIILVTIGGFLGALGHNFILGVGFTCLVLGIINIVLASLALAGHKGCKIAAGITAIISIFLGWAVYIFPTILLLIGGILLLCGKTVSKSKTYEETNEIKAVQPKMQV